MYSRCLTLVRRLILSLDFLPEELFFKVALGMLVVGYCAFIQI